MAKEVSKDKKKEVSSKDKKKFGKDFKAELKKVSWPSFKQLVNNTSAVIAIVLITAAIVFVLDVAFETLNKYGVENLKAIVTSNSSEEKAEEAKSEESTEATEGETTSEETSDVTTEEPTSVQVTTEGEPTVAEEPEGETTVEENAATDGENN